MFLPTIFVLAAMLSPVTGVPADRIDVDCAVEGSLARALERAAQTTGADVYLHGMCQGGIVIAGGSVTLRGATPDAGLTLDDGPGSVLVGIENAQVSLRNLTLTGGEAGVLIDGGDAEVLLYEVEVGEHEVGVFARKGARVRIMNSLVRDGTVGVVAQFSAQATLFGTTVTGEDLAVSIANESAGVITDCTIENNLSGGLELRTLSQAYVQGSTFHENGQIHMFAGGRSDLTLGANLAIGSETDTTEFALGASEHASISSYSTPAIYGHASALDRGSLRIGNATIDGNLIVSIFSDALVSNGEIVDGVFCDKGSDVVCTGGTTTPSVQGCPSTTCGSSPTASPSPAPRAFSPADSAGPPTDVPLRPAGRASSQANR